MRHALVGVIVALAALPARADWVEFNLPGTPLIMLIPARETKVHSGGTVTISHELGSLHVKLENVVKIHKAPTVSAQYDIKLRQAKKDPNLTMDVAKWALQRGMIRKFHETVDKVLELNPNHAEAKRLVELRKRLDEGCKESTEQEAEMRRLVKNSNMKFKLSKHFRLMHDTPDKPEEGRRKTRAEERLELLEGVYQAFVFKFHSQGVDLDIPKDHLKVVLFNNHKDYVAFGDRLGPQIRSTAGFYEHTMNTAVFFDQGSHASFEALKKLDGALQALVKQAQRERAPELAMLTNLARSIRLLIQIERESQDIEVVSHEATHQLAANTGLLPRYVMIPSWVHEGLATYFESPNDASWAGFGAVNQQRLDFYKIFADAHTGDGTSVSSIDFIVGDQVFDYARSHGAVLNGYAQAWALTHFLLERHFDRFMQFYQKLGDMPPDVHLSAEVLNNIFNDVFKDKRSDLQTEWKTYMNSLKTERDKVLGDRF